MNYETLTAAQRAAIVAAQQAAGRVLDFDAVRAAMKQSAEQLTDGTIHQVCIDAGLAVERAPWKAPAE